MIHIRDLVELIKSKNVILFVGAGVSMNLGLPSFSRLTEYVGEKLGYDPDVFGLFGDFLSLTEYYKLDKGSLGSLRSWMDREWHASSIDIGESKIHRMIVELDFPIIYTTNYDRWIEFAYDHYKKEYIKISNVSHLAKINNKLTQIIKFHGDFDENDSSIVLTESSYFERLDFESPLDIKLRSDIIGKSMLFLGYSLTDINTRLLFYKLNKLWKSSEYQNARPQSYIYLTSPNPVQERILKDRGIIPLVSDSDNPGEGLNDFLNEIVEKVSRS